MYRDDYLYRRDSLERNEEYWEKPYLASGPESEENRSLIEMRPAVSAEPIEAAPDYVRLHSPVDDIYK